MEKYMEELRNLDLSEWDMWWDTHHSLPDADIPESVRWVYERIERFEELWEKTSLDFKRTLLKLSIPELQDYYCRDDVLAIYYGLRRRKEHDYIKQLFSVGSRDFDDKLMLVMCDQWLKTRDFLLVEHTCFYFENDWAKRVAHLFQFWAVSLFPEVWNSLTEGKKLKALAANETNTLFDTFDNHTAIVLMNGLNTKEF